MRDWKAESRIIRFAIYQVLAQDFAEPKRFTDLWNYMQENKVCTKNTLWLYLRAMEKEEKIVRIHVEHKGKGTKLEKHNYALYDYKEWKKRKERYDKRLDMDIKRSRKIVDKMIKLVESGKLSNNEVFALVYCTVLDFELKQLDGLDLLLQSKSITAFMSPSLLRDFLAIPYNLRISFLWVCMEKCKEQTMLAINRLKENKGEYMKTLGYFDILERFGIKKTSG